MSLVDFDDDASFHTTTSAPTASFNGHNSIDDPFGFNVFGTGSTGTKQTTTVTETVFTGNNDKFFDDFDPLASFGEPPSKHEVTHTTRVVTTTTTSSDTQAKGDPFDPFGDGDFAPNGSGDADKGTSFESTKQSWVDDDFEASDRNDVTAHDSDLSSSPQRNEVSDEQPGVVLPEPSFIVSSNDERVLTSQNLGASATEQDTPASPHSDGVYPHSNTDAIDEILGDLHEETAPRAEMEDLSPLKPVEDKTSPDQFQSSPDSQFSFDGLSGSQKSATVEVVKPRNDSANEVAFSDNFSSGYAEMEDTMRSDISVVQKEDPAIEFQAPNADQPSPEVNIGEFKTDGNFDINFGVPSDPFLGGNDVPAISTLGSLNRQENLDFNGDVAGNPDFPREDLSNDFSPQNFELNAGSTNNPFTAGNFVPRDGTVQENFGLNADVSSNAFLSGNSTPREGSPSFKTDADERETLRQLVKDVRVEDHTSDLDQSITKVSTTTEINSAFLVSDSKASYEPDINFRPPKEREQKATPETVYNKMYNYRQDNSWKHKEMDVEDSHPVQFQINLRRTEEPKAAVQINHKQEEEEEDADDEGPRSDQFFEDIKDRSRSRISLDEIRQRSYEDSGPMTSPHYQSRKEQKPADKTPVVYVLGAAGDNICKVCAKRVYEMEKVTADLQVYHKTCFRCYHCNRILSLGNFSTNDGRLYCKPHFIEIFKTKGNYKDSFALAEQQKQRGDSVRGDDASSQDQDETGSQRNRRSSVGYLDDDERGYDEYEEEENRQRILKEELPTVPIKSVRNIFEKMSQDVAQPAQSQQQQQQKKKSTTVTKASSTVHVETTKRPTQEVTTERVRNDSEKSDLEIDRHKLLERRDSTTEVVQSSTTCIVEDELPPPAFTRSLLAKFKMMEDSHGTTANKAPAVYGAPVAKQTAQSAPRQHQTLSHRSSGDSRASSEPAAEETRIGRDAPDSIVRSTSQDRKEEGRTDELPQAGLAKSLLAQWRNLEEQSSRGRSREPRSSANARRSQSMSRVETVQRARLYPAAPSARSKQVEDIRPDAYSDHEASGDDLPAGGVPTKQRLAVFQGFDYGSEVKPKKVDRDEKAFKWEVKEPLPMNRGVLIVHGDVPRKPNPEEAAAAAASAARWSDSANEQAAEAEHRARHSTADEDDDFEASNQVHDDVVHSSTTTVIIEEELPPPATTRTLLQHFKSMEDVTKAPPKPRVAPAQANRDHAPKTKQPATVYANDEEDEHEHNHRSSVNGDENDYGASPDAGEFGNDPVRDASVIRESDRCDEEELPAQGTTKSLLAKFQSFQGKR